MSRWLPNIRSAWVTSRVRIARGSASQRSHNFPRQLPSNDTAMPAGRRRFRRCNRALRRNRAERGRDPRQMQPVDAVQQRVPVPSLRRRFRERRMRAVVDHFGRAHARAGSDEIQPHPLAAQLDAARIDPCTAQRRYRRPAEVVVRHGTDETDLMSEPGERGRDIRFRASDPHVELWSLQQQLAPRRREPEHDLPERQECCSPRQPAAVDREDMAGDIGGGVARQEHGRPAEIAGVAPATCRNAVDDRLVAGLVRLQRGRCCWWRYSPVRSRSRCTPFAAHSLASNLVSPPTPDLDAV